MDDLRDAFLNIKRRKIRSALAILGIGVGVFVLIVTGAMSEYFRSMSLHFRRTFEGRIFLCEKMSFWSGGGLISEEKLEIISKIPGAEDTIPLLIGRIDPEEMFALGMPNVLVGVPPDKARIFLADAPLRKGRWFQEGERSVVISGHDVAGQYGLTVGADFKIRDKRFNVIGILDKTGTLLDRQAFAPLSAAQDALKRPHLLTCIIVIPAHREDADSIMRSVKEKMTWLLAITTGDIEAEVKRSLIYWEVLTIICLMLSGITSFMCVSVIMVMAITERTKEIALKKAIGAEDRHIFAEYMMEVILICLCGWAAGLVLGWLFIIIYEVHLAGSQVSLFLVTPRLLAGSLLWALLIGLISGFLPARKAVSIEPVKAMRQV